nr:YlcI/YnfO family protein [Afifella sp. IM 167]
MKSARIEARIAPETLAAIRLAAELEGRSLSDFVVAAAEAEALRRLEEERLVQLSAEGQRRFVEALLCAPEPGPTLKRAKDHREHLIDGA